MEQLPPSLALTFKQVEAALAAVLGIGDDPVVRATFVSRLQQLQKLGLPWGSNSGRGSRVLYSMPQIAELLLYLDLLDLGIPPMKIADMFRDAPLYKTEDGIYWRRTLEQGVAQKQGAWLLLQVRTLDYLRTLHPADSSTRGMTFTVEVGSQPTIHVPLLTGLVVINLAMQLIRLAESASISVADLIAAA